MLNKLYVLNAVGLLHTKHRRLHIFHRDVLFIKSILCISYIMKLQIAIITSNMQFVN